MPGSTTELALKTAVDSDDNADYLTISLASSLQTVDALFSNTTGHSHSGAHQGGPIGTVPASAIPDGSITSAKITDGTIATADLADGAVTYAKIANSAASTVNYYHAAGTNSTSSGVTAAIPGVSIAISTLSGTAYVEVKIVLNNTSAGVNNTLWARVDGGAWLGLAFFTSPGASMNVTVMASMPFPGLANASHTFDLGWSTTGGTLNQSGAIATYWKAYEYRR
jgi:hypothetical protein